MEIYQIQIGRISILKLMNITLGAELKTSNHLIQKSTGRSFYPISPQLRTGDGGWAIQKSGVGFVQKEVKDALGYWCETSKSNIRLIPVRLDECDLSKNSRISVSSICFLDGRLVVSLLKLYYYSLGELRTHK